jgi:hypothetical protein
MNNDKRILKQKFGNDQDTGISVDITGDESEYCFRLHIDGGYMKDGEYVCEMHGRSLVDLAHKVNIAYLDWMMKTTAAMERDTKAL